MSSLIMTPTPHLLCKTEWILPLCIIYSLSYLLTRLMACSSSTSPPTKLGELLKEQQEPFTFDAYPSERWYLKNIRSCSSDFNKRRKPISYRGKLKSLLEKLNSVGHRKRLSHPSLRWWKRMAASHKKRRRNPITFHTLSFFGVISTRGLDAQ